MALAAHVPSLHARALTKHPLVEEMKKYINAQYANKTTIFRCQILPITELKDMHPPCRAREEAWRRQLQCEYNGAYAQAKCFCDEGSVSRLRKTIDDTVECAEMRGCPPEALDRIRCDMFRKVVAYQDGCGRYLARIREETEDIFIPGFDDMDEMLPFDAGENYVEGVPETCTDTGPASWGKKTRITVDRDGARVEELDSASSSLTVGGSGGVKKVAVLGLLATSVLVQTLL